MATREGNMEYRILTEQEARKISADPNTDNAPFRILNDAGKAFVDAWVARVAAETPRQRLQTHYDHAEEAINDAWEGDPITIDMPARKTASGKEEVLELAPEHFMWVLSTEA